MANTINHISQFELMQSTARVRDFKKEKLSSQTKVFTEPSIINKESSSLIKSYREQMSSTAGFEADGSKQQLEVATRDQEII
jgi:hypothetical protein